MSLSNSTRLAFPLASIFHQFNHCAISLSSTFSLSLVVCAAKRLLLFDTNQQNEERRDRKRNRNYNGSSDYRLCSVNVKRKGIKSKQFALFAKRPYLLSIIVFFLGCYFHSSHSIATSLSFISFSSALSLSIYISFLVAIICGTSLRLAASLDSQKLELKSFHFCNDLVCWAWEMFSHPINIEYAWFSVATECAFAL